MNFCPHGNAPENCPICMKSMGIKPPTQLITPAPRELPQPISQIKPLETPDPTARPFYAPSQTLKNDPAIPQRKFTLEDSLSPDKDNLFYQKKRQLEEKRAASDESQEILKKLTVTDVRKQFIN